MQHTWPYPQWIAHRGAGRLAPENTLAALRAGAALGYRGFECDVKLSADGVPFLLHDATLERTTNGQGDADLMRWTDLARLDAGSWHGRLYAGEPPASLEAVARYVRRNGFALNVEIKPMPRWEAHTGNAVAEHVARWWAGDALPPLLSSFKPDALQGARAAAPQLPRALLVETLWDGWLETALELQCCAIGSLNTLLDEAVVARIHAAGLRVLTYTVNDPAEAHRLLQLGVDSLITDAVDRFAPGSGVHD